MRLELTRLALEISHLQFHLGPQGAKSKCAEHASSNGQAGG
jgi:hypothetical protein